MNKKYIIIIGILIIIIAGVWWYSVENEYKEEPVKVSDEINNKIDEYWEKKQSESCKKIANEEMEEMMFEALLEKEGLTETRDKRIEECMDNEAEWLLYDNL